MCGSRRVGMVGYPLLVEHGVGIVGEIERVRQFADNAADSRRPIAVDAAACPGGHDEREYNQNGGSIKQPVEPRGTAAAQPRHRREDCQGERAPPETATQAHPAAEAREQQPAQEAKRVEPMPESLDLNALTDATVAASFGADDISETDGKTELTLTVYDYDLYDMVDIAQLAVGDTIVVDGKDMVVTSREDENGFVTINGGLEQGGVDLTSDDSGVYYAVGLDDTKSYHELGKVTVPVADGFVLTDNADPEHPDETYAAADLAELAASEPGFTANNTLATIEHGELTVLARSYTP